MGDDSLTVEILKQIHDELKSHGSKLDLLSTKIDHTNERLDRTNERLDRIAHEQIRHATAIVGLEGRMGDVVTELRTLNGRVDDVFAGQVGATVRETSTRVQKLEERVDALEKRSG